MNNFITLFQALDSTTKTTAKVNALVDYFKVASKQDSLWTIALFSHKRPKRTVNTRLLREWAAELAAIPQWLFEETYHIAGDLAETIAHIIPINTTLSDRPLSDWVGDIKAQQGKEEEEKKAFIISAWSQLDANGRFLFNKLITGGFRVGVSKKLMAKALAKYLDKEESEIAHRLMGDWTPDTITYEDLLLSEDFDQNISKPYPFYLAYAVEGEVSNIGDVNEWMAEYKWDGIRGQLIKRKGEVFLWSRGEELINASFPEFQHLSSWTQDDLVLDGEIVVWNEGKLGSFQDLQKRLGRKTVSKKTLATLPATMIVYDILEYQGRDVRTLPQIERRTILIDILSKECPNQLNLSEVLPAKTWEELKTIRAGARLKDAEGLMLKSKTAPYQDGRKKGGWWKWKLDPYTIDAVMLYAQRGHGRRTNLYTDYTFAVWNAEGKLVPFAKAYSGLTDAEFKEVTKFVNANTIEKFGPVRSVKPELVFEVAFEGITRSTRHKSGIALRFPRIHRWRKDKKAQDANRLEDLEGLL